MSLLEVRELTVFFTKYISLFRKQDVVAMEGLHLSVDEGEIVAVVGSSGSGKSLLAHAILGILPDNAKVTGEIIYRGRILDKSRLENLRGQEIVFVPQSVNYLDPLMKVGRQVHQSSKERHVIEKQRKLFQRYGLAEHVAQMYPHQLSGGMLRRVLVASAAMKQPRLIVADEPTPGMHPDDLREALQSFKELAEAGAGVVFITHDIDSALTIADKVAVFYAGTTVEVARKDDFAGDGECLRHPYTKSLWNALPQNKFQPISGLQPKSSAEIVGCLFADRCQHKTKECLQARPELRTVHGGEVRCVHAS